jgi:hypothetical protein
MESKKAKRMQISRGQESEGQIIEGQTSQEQPMPTLTIPGWSYAQLREGHGLRASVFPSLKCNTRYSIFRTSSEKGSLLR